MSAPTPGPAFPAAVRSGLASRRLQVIFAALIIFLILGVVFRAPLRSIARTARQRWRIERAEWRKRHEKRISWELISISQLSRQQLDSSRPGAIHSAQFTLDDPAAIDYELVRIRLRNEGANISDPLHFLWSAGTELVKILALAAVPNPPFPPPPFTHQLPQLRWRAPEPGEAQALLQWDQLQGGMAGFHVYASRDKNVGFGRITETLLHEQQFALPQPLTAEGNWQYLRVTAVSADGLESNLSPQVAIGNATGCVPTFRNTARVSLHLHSLPAGGRSAVFSSLSDALRGGVRYDSIIVPPGQEEQARAAVASWPAQVLSERSLECLQGKVRFDLPRGLKRGASVDVLVCCKAWPGRLLAPSLAIEPAAAVVVTNRGDVRPLQIPWPAAAEPAKAQLTPRSLRTYASAKSILLLWSAPASSTYAGVSIHRSRKGSPAPPVEIYDGPGATNELRLSWELGGRSTAGNDAATPAPEGAAPAGLSSAPAASKRYTEEILAFHFIDTAVDHDSLYTYTLIARDGAGNSSLPIVGKASLQDYAPSFTWEEAK